MSEKEFPFSQSVVDFTQMAAPFKGQLPSLEPVHTDDSDPTPMLKEMEALQNAKSSLGEELGSFLDAPASLQIDGLGFSGRGNSWSFDVGVVRPMPGMEETPPDKPVAVPAAALRPFQLVDVSDQTGKKVRVVASSVFGQTPAGFSSGDLPPFVLTGVTGTGVIWAKIVRNTSGTGTMVSGVAIEHGNTLPSNTATNYYVSIGSYSVSGTKLTLSNSRYGPINGSFCRNWFSNPPAFSIFLT